MKMKLGLICKCSTIKTQETLIGGGSEIMRLKGEESDGNVSFIWMRKLSSSHLIIK